MTPQHDDDKPVRVTESFSFRDLVQIASALIGVAMFLAFAVAKTNSVEAVMQMGFASVRVEIAALNTMLAQHIAQEEKIVGTLDTHQRNVIERLTTLEASQGTRK